MELNERKLRILQAIVDDYIATAMPVGSRTLTKKYISELSAATIRNEMSDLEELGFLDSPHTSAGRVPSYKAYRLYVDHIMRVGDLNADESKFINAYFGQRIGEMEQVIQSAAQAVSQATGYAALVMAPQCEDARLVRIQLVKLTDGMALVVLVTDTAVYKDTVIRVPATMGSGDFHGLSEMLTRRFAGKKLCEVSRYAQDEMPGELAEEKEFFRALTKQMRRSGHGRKDLAVDGALNIFQLPEYQNDMERAQSFLMALNSREELYDLLAHAAKWEFTVTIGPENEYEGFRDMSVVTASYKIADQPLGSVGVIGPVRMDYRRVIRVLNYMGRSMGEILSQMLQQGPHDGKG
ncbi:MAG: heat-inducible transcriptional repressor HrcA [Eubacteriales bacterium]|nr:heat-inducible transcriptional repressor HrcA [Eubacteriales bacterium]